MLIFVSADTALVWSLSRRPSRGSSLSPWLPTQLSELVENLGSLTVYGGSFEHVSSSLFILNHIGTFFATPGSFIRMMGYGQHNFRPASMVTAGTDFRVEGGTIAVAGTWLPTLINVTGGIFALDNGVANMQFCNPLVSVGQLVFGPSIGRVSINTVAPTLGGSLKFQTNSSQVLDVIAVNAAVVSRGVRRALTTCKSLTAGHFT